MRTTAVLVLAVASAAVVNAQVKPVEPFGGRPFGAAPGTAPPPDTSAGMPPVQPVQGPSVVAPAPTVVMQPGSTAVLGNSPQMAPAPVVAPAAPAPTPPPPVHAPVAAAVQPATGTPPAPAAPSPATPPFAGTARSTTGGAPAAAAPSPSAAQNSQQAAVRGLPADAPRVVVSGGTYSTDASKRLLIANGQVVREGADLGGGVVLEQVTRDGAVLGFRGSRYNVTF